LRLIKKTDYIFLIMKRLMHILWLRLSLYSLKNKRKDALLEIYVKYPKEVSRVDNLEDIRKDYFKEIDREINSKERLIILKSKKTK